MSTAPETIIDETHSATAGTPLVSRLLTRVSGPFRQFEDVIPWELGALTWYSLVLVVVENGVLQAINAWTGREVIFLENPLRLLNSLILLGAAVATHALYRRYDRAVSRSNLRERASDPDQFSPLVPDRLLGGIIAVGIAFTVVNAVVILTLPELYAVGGPSRVFRYLVILPFGYVPVLATFLATYLAVETLLPWRLYNSDVTLDFLDPEQLGGMRPIGELVKFAYYCLMLGLVGYAVALYGPFLLDGVFAYDALDTPGTAVNAAFTAVWAAAVVTMGWGIYPVCEERIPP